MQPPYCSLRDRSAIEVLETRPADLANAGEPAQHIRTVNRYRLYTGALPQLPHVQTGTPSSDVLRAPQATFESLFSSVAQGAYGIAMRLTRNQADAEDLLQDAALLAHRGFDSFEPASNFRAWFFKILINCYYSKRRKEKSRPVTSDLDDTPDLYLYARSGQAGFPTQGPDPAAQLLDKLGTERIVGAINRLPEDYRVVSTLYFMEDLSYEEIARALECPVGTVRSRLHRGRKMLQKALWEIAEEDGIVRQDEYPEDA